MNTFLLGTLMAIALGAGAHFILGGSVGKLFAMLAGAIVGFWIGHFLGFVGINADFANIGALNTLSASIFGIVGAISTNWLLQQNPER